MKKLLIISICISFLNINAQNCEKVSPYKKGMELEFTNYNKKGKERGVERSKVLSVNNTPEATRIKISQETKSGDPITFSLICKNGNFYVDFLPMVSRNKNASSFTIGAEGGFIEFPENVKSGDTLKDATINLKSPENQISLASMTVTNRIVKERGEIVTKAKTFIDGYKVTYDYVFKLGPIKFRGKGEEWYVYGIGIVKSMDFNKKGKLRSTKELTKISNF